MEQYIFSLMLRGLSEWRGMVMFIESVVAEKDSVTNIDRQLKNVYGVTAVSCWARKFQVLRQAEGCILFWHAYNSSSYADAASVC